MGDTHFDMPIADALKRLQADPTMASVFPFHVTELKVEVQAIGTTGMFLVTLMPQDGRPPAASPLPGDLVEEILAQLTEIEERKMREIIRAEAANLAAELRALP